MRCPSCPKRTVGSRQEADGSGPAGDEVGTQSGSDGVEDAGEGARAPSETDAIVDVIEELVRERDSGFGFPEDLTELEKQLVMIFDQTVLAYERAHEMRVAQMFEMLVAMTQR